MSAIYKDGTYYGTGGGGSADLPSGGTTGQVLAKHSNVDQDVEWKDMQVIRTSILPEASANEFGNVYQYTGTPSTPVELLISAETNFAVVSPGKASNCNIANNDITLKSIDSGYGIVGYNVPLDSGTLKVTVTKNTGTASYAGVWLGTTAGEGDLYQSSNWDEIEIGSTEEITIDLSNYTVPVYLSFRIAVVAGNTATFDITSAEYTYIPRYGDGHFYRCVKNGAVYSWEDVSTMTAEDLQDVKDAFTPNTGVPMRMLNYSTEEQIVGKWIDGKPIYQKTFWFESLNANADIKYVYAPNANIIVDYNFMMYYRDGQYLTCVCVPNNPSGNQSSSSWYENGIRLLTNSESDYITVYTKITLTSATGWTGALTVRYTKTTD